MGSAFQFGGDGGEQGRQADGFGDHREVASFGGFASGFPLGDERGQHEDGNFFQYGIEFHLGDEVTAVEIGHDDVEQGEIRLEGAHGFECLRRVIDDAGGVFTGLFEVQFEKPGESDLVVHDEDFFHVRVLGYECLVGGAGWERVEAERGCGAGRRRPGALIPAP